MFASRLDGKPPAGSVRIGALSHLDHIRSYYEALNTGDVDLVASHFTDDAVHYYTRLGPHRGARAIAENAKWAIDSLRVSGGTSTESSRATRP